MRKLLLAISATALMATGAIAADPVITVEPAYVAPSSGFDWDGFYMGVGITGLGLNTGTNVGFADVIAGFNVTSGNMLFGAEAWVGGWSSSAPATGWGFGAEARAGYLMTPEALVYVSGGAYGLASGGSLATVGAGVEFAINDYVSIDFEYKYWMAPGAATYGNSIGASALWHF